jgi:hypothetical protein
MQGKPQFYVSLSITPDLWDLSEEFALKEVLYFDCLAYKVFFMGSCIEDQYLFRF